MRRRIGMERSIYKDIDPLYEESKKYVIEQGKASASFLQRKFKIGYNRAMRIIDELESNGVIGPANGINPRKVLITEDES